MTAQEALDKNGVRYLWAKIKNYVAEHAPSVESISWGKITDKPDLALKSDISTVYRYQGSVPTYAELPTEGLEVGYVYDVVGEGGMNYGWTGTDWDPLGMTITLTAITNEEIDEITGN